MYSFEANRVDLVLCAQNGRWFRRISAYAVSMLEPEILISTCEAAVLLLDSNKCRP